MNLKCEGETLFCQAENMYCAGCGYSYLRNKDTSPTKTVFLSKKGPRFFCSNLCGNPLKKTNIQGPQEIQILIQLILVYYTSSSIIFGPKGPFMYV